MNVNEALNESKKILPATRYEHVERVVHTATELAKRFNGDEFKVGLAAALHDYAKAIDVDILRKWIVKHIDLPKDLLNYSQMLWHGPVGAKMVQYKFEIDDTDIVNAIYWHTTGRAHMSLTEKIVFLADYIEPGRDFPAVYKARELANHHLDQACHYTLRETIQFLMDKNETIYPDTFHAYNYFTLKLKDK